MANAALTRATQAYEERDWSTAVDAYAEAAAADEPLAGEDHLEWGMALYWARDPDGSIAQLETAADECRREGTVEAEIRALQVASQLAVWGERRAVLATCASRLRPLLESIPEGEPHALSQWATARLVLDRDLDEGARLLEEALATALRVKSPGAEALALMSLAQVDTVACRVKDAMNKVDAAAALALSGGVMDFVAGGVLCGIVWSCRNVGDWHRAAQWTDVATRWSERTGVSMYPGLCQFHECEILRFRGDLARAEQHAEAACAELGLLNPAGVGWGYRELGLIRLRRSDEVGAEHAFRLALEHGVDPNPGLALLRLRRGDAASARRGLEEALATPGMIGAFEHPVLLPVLVTTCIETGDIDAAEDAARELADLAGRYATESHLAASAQAHAEVALARGEITDARSHARAAWQGWNAVDAPYEAARARETIARIEVADESIEDAVFDLEAAKSAYERLGSTFDVERIDRELRRITHAKEQPQTRAFMFTDIVDSTRLQSTLGDDRWMSVLEWHDGALQDAFAEFDGNVIKHEGDGFFVAFAGGEAALRAGCRIQRVLEQHREIAGFAPEVRIGVHEGEATPRQDDWIGLSVTLAARVAASGGPGEVVCTDSVLESAPTVEVTESRVTELKGVDGPMTVHLISAWR